MDFSAIISKNKPELVKATNCTDALLDSFGKDILHDSEVSDLKAETRKYSRGSNLWDLLKQKSVTKKELIKLFEDHNQGAAALLRSLLPEGSGSKLEDVLRTDVVTNDDIAPLSDDDFDFIKNKNPFKVQVVYPPEEMNFIKDHYKLSREHKGYALVINITKFEDSSKNRSAAEHDTVYLVKLFSQLGFIVDYTDVNKMFNEENITEKVTEMRRKFQRDANAKCLAVYLGSHGIDGKVFMSNGKLINPHTEFAYKFIFNDLEVNNRQIAKLFFLSACEITPLSPRSTTDSGAKLNIQDAMFSLSTSPGYPSVGDNYLGTHYVNMLTKVFMRNAFRYDLNTMLDLMEETMRKLEKTDKEIQVPIHYGVSMKKLYFNLPKK